MGALLALLPILAPILERALGSIIPDPQARQRAIADIFGQLNQADVSQMEVNKVEAASASIFVAGWRPFIGWVCGSALAYQYILVPIGMWVGFMIGHPIAKPPTLDGNLWELMAGMLGMGALRSLEKIKRAAT